MTQLEAIYSSTDFDRTTTLTPVHGNRGEFSVEHGRIAERDGTLVAESVQTRRTTKD